MYLALIDSPSSVIRELQPFGFDGLALACCVVIVIAFLYYLMKLGKRDDMRDERQANHVEKITASFEKTIENCSQNVTVGLRQVSESHVQVATTLAELRNTINHTHPPGVQHQHFRDGDK